jgi:hypothetical protein
MMQQPQKNLTCGCILQAAACSRLSAYLNDLLQQQACCCWQLVSAYLV